MKNYKLTPEEARLIYCALMQDALCKKEDYTLFHNKGMEPLANVYKEWYKMITELAERFEDD